MKYKLTLYYKFDKLTVATKHTFASVGEAEDYMRKVSRAIRASEKDGRVVLLSTQGILKSKTWRDWKVVLWLVRKLEEWMPEEGCVATQKLFQEAEAEAKKEKKRVVCC